MGECFIVRRGGQVYQLPVLDSSYPQNVTVVAAASRSATFAVQISQPGTPAEYTYQWYKNGSAISGATGASVTLSGLTAAASHTVYCVVANKAGTVTSRVATLTVKDWKPAYTYTGSSTLIDDGNYRWRIRFLTSGTLTFSSLGNGSSIDAFCVGGGAGGAGYKGGGGGSGYTTTTFDIVTFTTGVSYTVTVGAGGALSSGGGTTSIKNGNTIISSANGGSTGDYAGGNGGSGGGGAGYENDSEKEKPGVGGSNGSNGGRGNYGYGTGQGTTTREFGETSGTLYAGGGGGGSTYGTYLQPAAGGEGGGGKGAGSDGTQNGTVNTGGGGGGRDGAGGSGIVIIRNHR